MKSKKKLAICMRAIVFLLLVTIMIYCLNRIFKERAISDTTKENFFHQTEETMDVLYLGNCHAYSAFMPSYIEEMTGLNGYMLGSADQNAETGYYYLSAALARQSPKYIVMEMFPYVIEGSYADVGTSIELYNVGAYSDLPYIDRLIHLEEACENGRLPMELLLELTYFHSRWPTLQSFGTGMVSEDKGWSAWSAGAGKEITEDLDELVLQPQTEECVPLEEESLRYLVKMVEMAQAEGIEILFVTLPYLDMTETEAARYNTIGEIAKEYGIPYLNFAGRNMIEELGFCRGYMSDANHLNESGARVVSEYVGAYIQTMKSEQ